MKTRLLWAACLLFAILPAKGQVKTFADLQQGDWLELEYVTFFFDSVPGDYWRSKRIQNIEFKATVIKKSAKGMTISVKPLHFFENIDHNRNQAHFFYDSYFVDQDILSGQVPGAKVDGQDFVDARNNDSLMVEIDLQKGILKDTAFILSNKNWTYATQTSEPGIRKPNRFMSSPSLWKRYIDARVLLNNTALSYFCQWADNGMKSKPMPSEINLDKDQIPGFTLAKEEWPPSRIVTSSTSTVRISGASFDLFPNVMFTYACKKQLPHDQLVLHLKRGDIKLTQKEDGVIHARFFLPSHEKVIFDKTTLLLSPGDSIYWTKDETGNSFFSGRGSGNCSFEQEKQKLIRIYRSTYDAKIKTRVEKMNGIYQSLWDKYGDSMDDYWMTSSQLSYKYWFIRAHLVEFGNRPELIPWDSQPFTSVFPYIDYRYQPENYADFMNAFFTYKMNQLEEDNLTGFKRYLWNDIGAFYIQEQLFYGYPRLLLMKNSLLKIMQNHHYSDYEREFNAFLQTCYEPGLRGEVLTLHRQLMQLEPGRKIQDMNPELAKLPFLKSHADGYIMLQTKNKSLSWDLTWTGNLWKVVKNGGLSGQVKAVALRPKEYIESLPDSLKSDNKYLYANNSLKLNEDLFSFFNGEFILLRNDGTIISREFTGHDFWKIPSMVQADNVVRDRKSEQSHETLWWILLAVLFTGIIVAAIAALRVRFIRRREKNKRKITELELKAIRSQMNPHFVFNALGSIQSLINQGKSDEANYYLVNFAKLLRMVLSSSEKKLVPLNEELEQLDLYLRLEQLRVPFTYDISAYSNVHPAEEEIPGMLIQPVVENAVIHGIVPKQGGHISIHIRKENNILFADITDDGTGIADEALKKNGFGIRAINERLALLNDEMKTSIGLEIENRLAKEGISGTRVTISIPV